MKSIIQNNPTTFQTGDLRTICRPQGRFNLLNIPLKTTIDVDNHTLSILNDNVVKQQYHIFEDSSRIGGCFWLSSIAMLLFADTHKDYFKDKKVLELGSGIGLPAMHIAKTCCPKHVSLSDIDSYITQHSSNLNGLFELGNTEVKNIDWDDLPYVPESEKYDIIIATDCIYRNSQNAFFRTVQRFLKSDGIFILANAYRDGLDDFIYSLEELYNVSCEEIELCLDESQKNELYSIKLSFLIANSDTFVDITHILK